MTRINVKIVVGVFTRSECIAASTVLIKILHQNHKSFTQVLNEQASP